MLSTSEERSLLPYFWRVFVQLILLILSSKLLEGLHLFFLRKVTVWARLSTTSDSCLVVGVSLLSLVIAFGVSFFVNNFLSSLELNLDFIISCNFTLHPWMGKNIFEFGSVLWVKGHHLLEQVFELSRVDVFTFLSFLMSLPEDFSTVCSQKAVMRIRWIGTAKWRSLSHNDEQNDC